MDTGDAGHSAWFQSRVQVLVRSLRSHQGASSSSQWGGDRLKEESETSASSPAPPPQRRSLQLGRSLATRWHQYSPGPLRRLKKLFSVTSERDQSDDWDSEADEVRKGHLENSDVVSSYSESRPLLLSESAEDTSGSEPVSDPQQHLNGTLKEAHQKTSPEESVVVSDHPVKCSQDLQNEPNSDSRNIPGDPTPEPSYNKASDIHSQTLSSVTEHSHIPCDSQESVVHVPRSSDTGASYDGVFNARKLQQQQQHDFNKQFYVLTTASEDVDDVDKECWQQGAMTQWRHTDSNACTITGQATALADKTDGSVLSKGSPIYRGGLSHAVNTCHSDCDRLTLTNGELDEQVKVLLKTETNYTRLSAVLPVDAVPEAMNIGANCNTVRDTAHNVEVEGSVCDKVAEGANLTAVVRESAEVVTKSDMETPIVLSCVDEEDSPPLSVPRIVLDLPKTIGHPPTSPEVTSSDLQAPNRHPKLQLQIASACSQSSARKSPVTVQEWVDSLPLHQRSEEEGGEDAPLEESDDHLGLGLGAEAGLLFDALPEVTVVSPAEPHPTTASSVSKVAPAAHLVREPSVQSDVTSHTGSHCSSVESYLESRRPDPEEILLGLGFGGPVGGAGGVDTEVSRIPRRFLQPSKVKGVAIDDFLRYQQDLIETFESGFCGYRGLTGPSHTPASVIVAKIMEKLREHERENIPPSSVTSAPVIGDAGTSSPSLPSASSKFSRAARRVLTHTSVLGALPFIARQQQQQQQQSVLTPDNRRFLDSQGNKSPEVPRKRMIIGHRSYTFGCDGDLIELDPVSPETPTPNITPKPKPLLHKDSVLSTATSLSFTSVDSDSDTDDHSSGFGLQPRCNIVHNHPTTSTPKSTHFSFSSLSQDSISEKPMTQKACPPHPVVSKRMSSTSLSSWESEAVLSPMNSSSDVCLGVRHKSMEEHMALHLEEEQNNGRLRMITKHYSRFHSSPDIPLSVSWPVRYESIDEDVEMKSDRSASILSVSANEQFKDTPCKTDVNRHIHCCDRNEEENTKMNNGWKTESKDIAAHVGHQYSSLNGSEVGGPSDVHKSTKTVEEQVQIQKDVISLLQIRRGSLKRQQRILDDEPFEMLAEDSSELKGHENTSGMPHEGIQSLALETDDARESSKQECVYDADVLIDETSQLENSRIQELGTHENQCVRNAEKEHPIRETLEMETIQKENTILSNNSHFIKDEAEPELQLKYAEKIEESQNTDLLQVACMDTRGDSFEMEEICTYGEEEGRTEVLSRAWSDSSGFLDGDSETCLLRHNGHSLDATTTILESSQHGGSSVISSAVTQITSDTSEITSQNDLEVTNLPSCTSSDILKSGLVVSLNLGDGKPEPVECPTDFSLTSPTKECVQRREIGSSAINQQNLPNNLYEELSNVNGWLGQCNVPSVQEHVCDLSGSCTMLHEHQKSLASNLLEEVSSRCVCKEKNSSVTNSCTSEEATAQSFPVSNNAVPCGKSAVIPGVQNFLDRTLVGNHIPPCKPPACVGDDSEQVRHRTMSLHSIDRKNGLLFGGVRRVRSAPHCLDHLALGDDMMRGSSWGSISNTFSFCSDESVIHVGVQKASLGGTNEKRLSDVYAGTVHRPEVVAQCERGFRDVDSNSIGTTQYLKPCAGPSSRNTRISPDATAASRNSVRGLHELVGELADRGWDITMGTDSSHFACHTDQQLLRLQGDAVRAGLAAYGRQLIGGQANEHNGSHELTEASKELQAVRDVRDKIAAELRRVADLLEEQPPHRAANITGQMAMLLREQARLCQQLEALSCESSPSIFVEPAPCCSVLEAVREENRRLQNMIERNSQELKEIRQLLKELVAVKNSQF